MSEFFAAAVGLRVLADRLPRKDEREAAQGYADLLHRAGVMAQSMEHVSIRDTPRPSEASERFVAEKVERLGLNRLRASSGGGTR